MLYTGIFQDFRRDKCDIDPIEIDGKEVEIVDCFKYQGVYLTETLKWVVQICENLKKAQKRMFFLRQLMSFHVNQNTMINFHSAVIESYITCSIIIWFMAAPKKETNSLT